MMALCAVTVAYFHAIGELDNPNNGDIIDQYVIRGKHPNTLCLLPDITGDDDSSIIPFSRYYFYQNAAAHRLKLLSECMVTLSVIRRSMLSRGTLESHDLSGLGHINLYLMRRDIARLLRFADHAKLFNVFSNHTRNYNEVIYPFLSEQFSSLLSFKIAPDSTESSIKASDWNKRLTQYLDEEVFPGQFVVDVWIGIIAQLMMHSNEEIECLQFKVDPELIQEMKRTTSRLREELSVDALSVLQRAREIQKLAVDKLALFDAAHFVLFLKHWMLTKQTNKDIHIFVNKHVLSHRFIHKYMVQKLESLGVIDQQMLQTQHPGINICDMYSYTSI